MALDDKNFFQFRDFIYNLTGIWFEDTKRYILQRRLEKRIAELGLSGIKDYYFLLKSDSRGTEISNLINEVTTNETYFFRNLPQIKLFSEELLPKMIKEKRLSGNLSLKIWSAACSTGEEPYTMGINILENLPDISNWSVQILANDINREVLNIARRGLYRARAVKDVHSYYINKYFNKSGGNYEISSEVKKYVRFFYMNLVDEKQMKSMSNVDVIFCRNVLIYFDDKSRKAAVGLLYDALRKGGYIFLGHSESMSRISSAFKLAKFENGIIYMKE
jgi:chemotaxis protein methyltransferase CheR